MIWISTLCLLAIAAWLFFNAMNERRWVEAHSHDETVARDKGLFPALSSSTGSGSPAGKVSLEHEDSGFARAVNKVQQTTSKYGEKLEAKVSAARVGEGEQAPRSAGEENTLFGRAVARVGERTQKMDLKLEEKLKSASRMVSSSKDALTGEDNVLARAKHKVSETSEDMGRRMKEMTARHSEDGAGDGALGRIVGGVSDGTSKMKNKLDEQIAKGRAHVANRQTDQPQEDLMTRVSAKVGSKINELDRKLIHKNKDTDNID